MMKRTRSNNPIVVHLSNGPPKQPQFIRESKHDKPVFGEAEIDTDSLKENIKPSNKPVDASGGNYSPTSKKNIEDPSSFAELRHLVESETERLRGLCEWGDGISQDDQISEAATDSIRSSIGQCQLLLSKKIPFLMTLIDDGEKELKTDDVSSKTMRSTRLNDVLGYWSLVATEITLVDSAFDRLRQWRSNGQWSENNRPATPARSQLVSNISSAVKFKRRGRPKRIVSSKVTSIVPSTSQSESKPGSSRKRASKKLSDAFISHLADELPATPSQASGGRPQRSRHRLVETLTPLGLLPVTPSRTRSGRRSAAGTGSH